MGRRGKMAKAQLLVEVHGGRRFGVGFQIEPMGTEAPGFIDSELKKAAANATPAYGFRNGHFGELKFAGRDDHESTAADGLAVSLRHEDSAAGGEDVRLRVAENFAVGGLEDEVFADPVLVETEEGSFVAGAEGAQQNAVGMRSRHARRLAAGSRSGRVNCRERKAAHSEWHIGGRDVSELSGPR